MHTIKAFLVAGFFSVSLYAIDIQEAISLALTKSHLLKEQQHLLEEAQYNVHTAQKGYYPKLNTNLSLNNSPSNSSSISNSSPIEAKLQLRYNLFNGFKDWYDVKNKESLVLIQSYQLQAIKQDLILAIKTAYIQLLKQKHQLLVAEESVKLLEQQKKETKEFHRVGIVPKNDLLKVEVQLSNAKQNLLSTQSTLAYMKQDLERHIGESLQVQDLKEVQFALPTKSFEELHEIMLYSRSELKAINEHIKAKHATIKHTQSNYYPSIDIVGEQNFKNQSQNQNQSVARMEISLNLFDGFSTMNDTEAKRSHMLSLYSKASALKEELRLQLFSAYESYLLAINAYEVSQEALNQAEENYRIASNRYKERIESTSNFLDAEFLLTQAKTNLIFNRYGISQAIARIVRITESQQ